MSAKSRDTARFSTDPDDETPELTDEQLATGVLSEADRVIRRGKPGRPKLSAPKEQVTLRLDHDVVDRFRATGPGWQSRINAALREHLDRHR